MAKKWVFILLWSKRTKGGAIDQSGHLVVSTSYLRLIRLEILRIIFVPLKKRVCRTGTELKEIFPAEIEPRIRPLQFHQDIPRNALAGGLECAADL